VLDPATLRATIDQVAFAAATDEIARRWLFAPLMN